MNGSSLRLFGDDENGATLIPRSAGVNHLVVKSNRIVEAQYRLTANQQKLLAACISQINPKGKYKDVIEVRLNSREIADLCNVHQQNVYDFAHQAGLAYQSIPIDIGAPGEFEIINIAMKSAWDKKNSQFYLVFHPDIVQELVNLSQYTKYELRLLTQLSSKYTMRLFELLMKAASDRYRSTQYYTVDLDQLKFLLGIQRTDPKNGRLELLTKAYNRFVDFRKKVIDAAKLEIESKTHLRFEYEQLKAGRKVAGLRFIIRFETPSIPDSPCMLEELVKLNVGHTVAKKLVRNCPGAVIASNIQTFKEHIEAGLQIKNPTGYFKYLIDYNVSELPDVANPYASRYKNDPGARSFVDQILMRIWWDLPEIIRIELLETGLDSICINRTYLSYRAEYRAHGELSALTLFDKDYVHSTILDYAKACEGSEQIPLDQI